MEARIMPLDMNQFFSTNFIRAEELEENVVYEATIVSVDTQTLRGKVQPVIWFVDERGIVLNHTRLKAMVAGYGSNGDDWIGQVVRYRRGSTMFQGQPAATIEIVPPPHNAK
jgi:hypothetical protein